MQSRSSDEPSPNAIPDVVSDERHSQGHVDHFLETLCHRLHWPNDAAAKSFRGHNEDDSSPALSAIDKPTVFICGHGSRDERCGILGPMLQNQFQQVFKAEGLNVTVGQITHIGGHKFAGNVIMYLPPSWSTPLAGKSIWYGRVEPSHCEGLVKETVLNGKVIQELYRGSMAGAEP
ncbi:MAG: hypothetical protein Q9162_005057 [Coniocarpon cinnabarinum]